MAIKEGSFTSVMSDLVDALQWAREHWRDGQYKRAELELENAQYYIEQLLKLVKENQ